MDEPTIVNLKITVIGTFGVADCTLSYGRIPAPTKHIAKLMILQENKLQHIGSTVFVTYNDW